MEKKSWDEYTNKEQEELLLHWWHYYGKDIYTLAEREEVVKLIKQQPNQLLTLATVAYIDGVTTRPLLTAIRTNQVEKIFQDIQQKTENPSTKDVLVAATDILLDELVATYNNPEPDIPLEQDELLKQLEKLIQPEQQKDSLLTPTKVTETFKKCMFQDEEIIDNKPTKEYTVASGVMATTVFNTRRINEQKPLINELLNQIKDIEYGVHFTNLCITKDDQLWTGDHAMMDQLMTLGLAAELINIPFDIPRDMWYLFPEALPYVIKNNKKVDEKVVGKDPSTFPPQKKKK